MSQSIDEKVVALRFNNRQFAEGVDSTLKDLDRLNNGFKLDGASKGLEKVADSAKDLDLSHFERSIDTVRAKIGVFQTMTLTAVQRMSNALIDFGKTTIDNFAIKPVSTGFDEYELKMGSIQTIMASTGESIGVVNKYLDELNEYSDKTIYSFSDMTESIGKFTNAGVPLKDAVNAIKGISNEAAVSGANANEASRAMYNFAQALSAGYVKLIDWKSIENANMATVEFKDQLLQTAVEIGTVSKEADGMYKVITTNAQGKAMKETIDATRNFNDSLSYQWMTTDVLTKTLARYSDEETDIGKKAYAAAQDVKTFSMMIDTLSEAAQSGWATTWQYIVGDFEEAKSLFTELTNFFDEILSSSAKARNELIGNAMRLQNENGLTGREALWQSLLNTLEHIRAVIGAIKDGFFDIFPPITDQHLRAMIEGLLNFTKHLDHSDAKLQKIRQTFRGIFAVLDMFVTTIRFVVRVATKGVKTIVNIMTTLLFGGFALLLKWIEKIKQSDTGFNGWLNRIGKGLGRFAEYIKGIDRLDFKNVLGALRSFGADVIGSIFNFDGIKEAFIQFDKTISKYVDKSAISLSGAFGGLALNIDDSVDSAEGSMNGFVRFLKAFKGLVLGVLQSLTQNISLDDFSFGKVFAIIIAGSLLLVITTTTKLANKLGGVLDSISGMFDRFENVLKQTGKAVKSFGLRVKAEALFTISKSILVLTGALIALSLINPDGLNRAMVALGLIAAGLVAVSLALGKVGTAKQSLSFAAIILSMSASIKILVTTMKGLTELGDTDIKQPLKLLAILSAGLIAAVKILGSADKKHYAGIFTTINFVISLRILVGLLKQITEMNLKGVSSGLKTLFGILGFLTLSSFKVGKQTMGTAASIMAMALALKMTIGSIAKLGEMDVNTVNTGIKAIAKVFAAFSILLVAAALGNAKLNLFQRETDEADKNGKKAQSNLKDLGNAILKISASLLVIGGALKIFSTFTPEEIDKGTKLIGKLLLFFGALVGVSYFAGEHADKAGKMILQMSIAMISFVGLMSLMTLYKDPSVLKGPMKLIGYLMVMLGSLVALSSYAAGTENTPKVIDSLTKAVISISASMILLSLIKTDVLRRTALSMSLVLGTFGMIVAASKFAPVKTKGITAITFAVLAISGVLTALSLLKVENVIQNATGMAIVMSALAGSMLVISKTKGNNKGLIMKLSTYTICIGLIGGILTAMSKLGVTNAIGNAGAIAIVMTSLSTAMWIVSKSSAIKTDTIAKLGVFASLMTLLNIIFGALHAMGVETGLKDVASLSIVALALAKAFEIFGKAGDVGWKQVAQLTTIMAATTIVGYLIQWLGINDFNMSIKGAVSLGALLAAVSSSLLILDKSKGVEWKTVGQVAAMSGVLMAIGTVIGLLEKHNFKVGIQNAASLSLLLIAVSTACFIASKAGTSAKAAFVGIGAMITMVAAMGLLMWGIGSLVRDNPTIEQDIEKAAQIMGLIGLGLGSLIGEFIGGVAGGIIDGTLKKIGDGLTDFSEAIQPFLENMHNIDPDAIEKAGDLAGALVKFTGAEILDRISGWLRGTNSMQDFAEQLGYMADGLVDFSEKTQNIKRGTHVGYAIATMQRLAQAADEIPNTGGKLAEWIGDNNMGTFAEQFPLVGKGLVDFCETVKEIKVGPHVNQAVEVLKTLAYASKEIPNTGGLLGSLVGNNDMGPFAEQLPIMANGIVSFAYRVSNLDYGPHIQNACDAIVQVAHAAQEIPNAGGMLAHWIGDNEMAPFALQLPIMGQGIKNFCDNIKGLDTGNVDEALMVARDIAHFSNDLANTGGMWQDVFGSVSVEEFGRQLTWLGHYMWVYSTWINQIKDFSKFEKSVEAVKMLAEMANIVGDVGYVDFDTFGKKMTEYAEDSLLSFTEVFDKADLKGKGSDLGEQITKGIKSTRLKFVTAAGEVMKAFLNALDKKITGSTDSVKTRGKAIANTLLDSITDTLNSSDVAKGLEFAGNMTTAGFVRGVKEGGDDVNDTGVKLAQGYMKAVQDTLEIHSPSKWGEWIGNMTTSGISNGLTEGASGLLNNFSGIWDTMQSLSADGIQGVKDIIGTNGLWDFTAPLGDNLVSAKDKFKEWLGFGGEGGLADMFGFGNLSEELEQEIAGAYEGIQNGMSDLADKVGGSGGASAVSNLSEALSLTMHKHFDYEPFIHLGKQIGDSMAIAANNAIVSKAKATGEMFAEVVAATAGGLDMWKAWAEERKTYGKLSTKDELAGWALVQKMYEQGTKERMEADKQVYSLQKDLVKGTFEYSKQWIENEKYYKRLALADELAAWERVQARYLEGTDERIEAEKEVFRVKEELRQKEYEDAKKFIEKEKKLEKLSLAAELAAYKKLQATTAEGSDEREEMDDKIFDLEKEIYEAQKEYIENVTSIQENAKEERIRLEEEYAEKVKDIESQLASDIESLNQKYADSVDQRANSLYNAYSLFDSIQEKEADKDVLMQNLQDQVYAFSNWRSEIQSLANRGLDEALIDELVEMGPSAAAEIKALNSMTDAELGKYNLLWSQKSAMAREQAIGELEDLRVETTDNITKLQEEAAAELDEYRATWAAAMKKINADCSESLTKLRTEFGEKVGTIKKDTEAKLREIKETANKILTEAGFQSSGEQIVNGIIAGIDKKQPTLINKVAALGAGIVTALNLALKIKSPSRETYQTGVYAVEGLVMALEALRSRAYESGYNLGWEVQNGAYEAVKYVSEVVSNGVDMQPRIVPVIDFSNAYSNIADMNAMFDNSEILDSALVARAKLDEYQTLEFKNPNENVVSELKSLRSEVVEMGEKMAKLQVVLDTGEFVGAISDPLDSSFGTKYSRNLRERG